MQSRLCNVGYASDDDDDDDVDDDDGVDCDMHFSSEPTQLSHEFGSFNMSSVFLLLEPIVES